MDFSAINKKQADSFAQQKRLLKQLSQGKAVYCEQCRTRITLAVETPGLAQAKCTQGCTDILLQLG